MAHFALAIQKLLSDRIEKMAIGIHCGRVVAGLLGTSRFCYDIFGDTVNMAARLMANQPKKISGCCIHLSPDYTTILHEASHPTMFHILNCKDSIKLKGKGDVYTSVLYPHSSGTSRQTTPSPFAPPSL
eukprot:TRINITY_DN67312_c3_g1_i1.p1 TRINITY_DN67312_c3_g1~~TRINITY_DN67312_c3_g1_i1.p1  ORF type:complete len:129 (-),score=5.71 TRINITY_DN67312_c3_g1_i1:7-393(-)